MLRGKTYKVHRLVCEAFNGPCPDGLVCCHEDEDAASDGRDGAERRAMDTHITIPMARLIELESAERERDLLRSDRALGREALAAALGWPGGISGPLPEWRHLLQLVAMRRVADERLRSTLDAIVRALGPQPPACEGCAAEIAAALRIARGALP